MVSPPPGKCNQTPSSEGGQRALRVTPRLPWPPGLKGKGAYFQVYERVKDRLAYLKAEPLTEEKLQDRRDLAKILLHRVSINKEGKIRIKGHIPEVRELTFFTSSLPRYR